MKKMTLTSEMENKINGILESWTVLDREIRNLPRMNREMILAARAGTEREAMAQIGKLIDPFARKLGFNPNDGYEKLGKAVHKAYSIDLVRREIQSINN